MLYKYPKRFFSKPFKVDYSDLFNNSNLNEIMDKAFGNKSLGLIAVKNIPNFRERRQKLLTESFKLTKIKEEHLAKLMKPEAQHSVGWSKGLQHLDDGCDYNRGSFYARINNEKLIFPEDPEMENNHINVWPDEIQNYKDDFQSMGKLMITIQLQVLKLVEKYLCSFVPQHKENSIYELLKIENDFLGHLTLSYPQNSVDHSKYEKIGKKDNWCGWHRDYGIMTGLTYPMYFSKEGEILKGINSGLLVKSRLNEIHKLEYEEDEMVLQSGDLLFIFSGGNIVATPHAVKVYDGIPNDVYRINYINFFEPMYSTKIKPFVDISIENLKAKDPFKMEGVITKYQEGMIYKDFIKETYKVMNK